MVKVKINNKTYNVGELDISDYVRMEEQGISLVDAFHKRQFFLVAMGFVCVVAECERPQAENLLQQHIYGGGTILDIIDAFNNVVAESDFFQKMLGIKPAEEEKKTTKAKKAKEEEPEE